MSEKQYELKEYDNGLFIQDNWNDKVQYYSQSKASMSYIVDKLNELSEKLYEEQCRARPVTLTTHISDEDWKKFKRLFEIYCDNGADIDD